ncbi:family 1 encapsulin nanocompartment shell protein [Corynebacterium pacaense]|uniref:family 1 encapsulin nanocompartment shell protein n=1 Tax=Corynebacterium pacaense TaxID=1816684 RepID=UPI0009B9D9E0|nr:family 1 encapsulin nanocompartment shell protein [Corynebacterium pacaense]
MNHLLRERAPITPEMWKQIDEEATSHVSVALGARKLVDFAGPFGWEYSATSLGRVGAGVASPVADVTARSRQVLPLAELRADFPLSREELETGTRGAEDVDYDALDAAALNIARVENAAIIDGWSEVGITGILQATPHEPIVLGEDPRDFALRVAAAVAALRDAGIGGPYGIALGEDAWINVQGGSDRGGAPLLTHLGRILDGPIVWAPGISSAVVLSTRGGDFLMESGQDLAIGYAQHDASVVDLYLQETFSFRVVTPEAAIAIV